jgi:hypothetical protein
MGVVSSAGSFGQFLLVPSSSYLIQHIGWHQALVVLATALIVVMPLLLGLREPAFADGKVPVRQQSILQALREAFGYRSFQLLMAG